MNPHPPKSPRRRRAKPPPGGDDTRTFELLLEGQAGQPRYSLRLYITGTTARSTNAIANVRALCDEYLAGQYDLEVIDIYQQPSEALTEQIVAAPTLVKRLPMPLRRLVGDLSDRERVISGLNLTLKGSPRPA